MRPMITWGLAVALAAVAAGGAWPVYGVPVGQFFTYQGQLLDAGSGANGDYDLRFTVYDADGGGLRVGRVVAVDQQPVRNGLFTVQLDFGSDVFTGEQRWLEIAVRPGAASDDAPYTVLSPRQNLTAAPYALYSREAGTVPWSRIEDVPPQFLDGTDADTTYVAGTGLTLTGVQFSVSFAGTGAAFTAARSDHQHDSAYVAKTGGVMTGDLVTTRVEAGEPTAPACDGVGDVCAAGTVVGEAGVVAIFDVTAGRLVKAGVPTDPACAGSGRVCADHDVVADDAVRAGGDVVAGTSVKAGTVTNASCNGAGDVCAGDDAVADRQVRAGTVNNPLCDGTGDVCAGADLVADGAVYQGRNANGLVKAGVRANCSNTAPAIARSFNNVNGTPISISAGAGQGRCTIDFGFTVDDRYVVATASDSTGVVRGVTVGDTAGSSVELFRWTAAGAGAGGPIDVLVY